MIVLVPVSRFRVAYELARGRPYSRLERRVLEAVDESVKDGGIALHDLRTTFRVHDRLLVESVVTLVAAGWVAVAGGSEARFVPTAAGREAAESGSDPVSVVVTPAKAQTLVLERVTGQLARAKEARSYHRDELSEVWRSAARIPRKIIRNAVDEAQVQSSCRAAPGNGCAGSVPSR